MSGERWRPRVHVHADIDLTSVSPATVARVLQAQLWEMAKVSQDFERDMRDEHTELGKLDQLLDWVIERIEKTP